MRSTPYPPRRRRAETEPLPAESSTVNIDEIDELLEEIDGLLEDQAVLTNFRQRSGQ
jgi:hypothetical protein